MTKLEVPIPSLAAKKESAKRSAQAPHPFDNWETAKAVSWHDRLYNMQDIKQNAKRKSLRVKDPRQQGENATVMR
jgi:hypothetical protein